MAQIPFEQHAPHIEDYRIGLAHRVILTAQGKTRIEKPPLDRSRGGRPSSGPRSAARLRPAQPWRALKRRLVLLIT